MTWNLNSNLEFEVNQAEIGIGVEGKRILSMAVFDFMSTMVHVFCFTLQHDRITGFTFVEGLRGVGGEYK